MPVYDYRCKNCWGEFEISHPINEDCTTAFCERCNREVEVEKLVSKINFRLEGGGWSKDGYVKQSDLVKETL